MLPLILSVIVISFSGAAMPGPMFAVTLAKSYKSPYAGAQVSLGHAVVEVPLIVAIYFGFANFFENSVVQFLLGTLGGLMIIYLGISMFRARKEVVRKGGDFKYSAFTAGIITTGLNPLFFIWWATVGSLLVMKFLEHGTGALGLFIGAHWLVDLVWLSFVSFIVYKTHSFWGARFQEWVFIACSLLLIGFGAWYFVTGMQTIL